MTAVLSLDIGTNGARAGVFDVERRRVVAKGETGYPTRHLPPNRAEQDPLDWWRALKRAVPEVLAEAGHPEIAAISVATFSSTVVICDRAGTPLAPAILWMDARPAEEAGRTAVDHPVMQASGGSDAVEWLVRLTGLWCGSLMNATCKWNYDRRGETVDPALDARTIGLSLANLKNGERVIGIAAGAHKDQVALGALSAGLVNILVTDEATARYILDHAHDR